MARLPIQVPIPRPRPEGFANIPPAGPSGPSVAVAPTGAGMAITSPQQVQEMAAADAVAAPAGDPRMGGIPPANDAYADPYWGGVAAAANQYRASGESPLAAGLGGFVNAMAAADRIAAENARQQRADTREDERWQWAKDERAIEAEDRAWRRRTAEEQRDYQRERDLTEDERWERQFGLTERAADRADDQHAREGKMFDYDLLSKGIAVETALEKLQGGAQLDATDMKNLADGERVELQNVEDDMEMSEEQKSAKRAEIRSRYDRARGLASRGAAGEGGSTDVMQKSDMPGNPGAVSGNNEEVGELPPAGDEGPGFFGRLGSFITSGEPIYDVFGSGEQAAAAPAPDRSQQKPSEVFAKAPKFSGKGTADDPLVIPGAALSKQEMEQVMFLHMKPGQWVLFNGQPIQRLR